MQNVKYNEIVDIIRNNMAAIMDEDSFYEGYDIEVTSELQFVRKQEGYRNRIYIVVKFSPATIFFGQTVLSFTVTAISEHNHCYVCQKLLSDYAQKYNLQFEGEDIQQIYETPSVSLNFNELYEGFAAVMTMGGTFVIATTINRFDFYYKRPGEGEDYEKIDLISSSFNFENNIDSQAFYGTHDIADSIARIGSFSCSFAIYLFTNSKIINDCLKIVALASENNVPVTNIDSSFDLKIQFKAKQGDQFIVSPISVKLKLVSFVAENKLGELPILSLAFSK